MEEVFNPYVTMSITSLGASTLPKNEARVFATRNTNDVSDIVGASPKIRPVYDKPVYQNSDISGATSKTLSHSRNCQDNTLFIDDIDGTRHSIKDRMMRTTRRVDPLNPVYPLPSYTPGEHAPTRFVKDPQAHDDIEGSHVKPKKVFAERDTMGVSDIFGAQTGWRKKINKDGVYDSMHADSYKKKRVQDSGRRTDPCDPVYFINGMTYKDDKHSKPPPLPAQIMDSHLLQTKDITGATPGLLSVIPRREWKNTNYIADIEGTQADSTKHSIVTNRQSNPLTPMYQSLDPGEYLAPVMPLIPADMIKVPTIPRSSKAGVAVPPATVFNQPPKHGGPPLDFTNTLKNDSPRNSFGTQRSEGRSGGRSENHHSNFTSPLPSGRSQSNKAASSLLIKAASERSADIDAVRQLPM